MDYVSTDALATIIEKSYHGRFKALADAVGTSDRVLRRIRKRESQVTDYWLADRILTQLGKVITLELTVVGRPPYRSRVTTLPEGDPRHGTHNGYSNHGCRCELCCEANTAYYREYRARRREHDLHGQTEQRL